MRTKKIDKRIPGKTYKRVTAREVRDIFKRFKGHSERLDKELNEDSVRRFSFTASNIPCALNKDSTILDIGGTVFWLPIYQEILGYKNITIICRPGGTFIEEYEKHKILNEINLKIVECDAEMDIYPLPAEYADCIICCELLEHLAGDPMNIISEGNRILKNKGIFCMTTPNVLSRYGVIKILFGGHPYSWSSFTCSFGDRHNREYTPNEIIKLYEAGGFFIFTLISFDWIKSDQLITRILAYIGGFLLTLPATLIRMVPFNMRKASLLISAQKAGKLQDRYPLFLYDMFGEKKVSYYGKLGGFSNNPISINSKISKKTDTVSIIKIPDSLRIQDSCKLRISYNFTKTYDVLADLFEYSKWHGQGRLTLAEGAGEIDIKINIEKPLKHGYGYYFTIKIVPEGASWEEHILDIKSNYLSVVRS